MLFIDSNDDSLKTARVTGADSHMGRSVLEADHVTREFGPVRALHNVCLSVAPGEIYCLLGANGAGKTTLVNLFLDFLEPTSGEVRINGRSAALHPIECKRDIAYIPETVMLYGVLSGCENLDYFVALATGERRSRKALIELLEEAGLDPADADRRVSTYARRSSGPRRTRQVCSALARFQGRGCCRYWDLCSSSFSASTPSEASANKEHSDK